MIENKENIPILYTRDDFRNAVFKRETFKCVICGLKADDAHHIIDRKLFKGETEKGGYFIDNGVSLCEPHHMEAEKTTLSCEKLRQICGISTIILPEHLDSELEYDKWGNIITKHGRLKGELYYEPSVQKLLKDVDFVKYIKYPRTFHVPWSEANGEDKILRNDSQFINQEVFVSIKMDGENFTGYNDYCHARSIYSENHPSRKRVKDIWFQRAYMIDENMRVCCENLYAKHTISYDNLKSYLYLLSIWIDDNCLDWKETKEYAEILNLPMPDVFYEGIYDKDKIIEAYEHYKKVNKFDTEGYVIRLKNEFKYFDFSKSIAKFVEPKFRIILNDAHGNWINKKIIENKIINEC